jgi:hypothetical protein
MGVGRLSKDQAGAIARSLDAGRGGAARARSLRLPHPQPEIFRRSNPQLRGYQTQHRRAGRPHRPEDPEVEARHRHAALLRGGDGGVPLRARTRPQRADLPRDEVLPQPRDGACTGSSDAYGPPARSTRGSPGPSISSRGSFPPCAVGRSPRTSSRKVPSSSACRGGEDGVKPRSGVHLARRMGYTVLDQKAHRAFIAPGRLRAGAIFVSMEAR